MNARNLKAVLGLLIACAAGCGDGSGTEDATDTGDLDVGADADGDVPVEAEAETEPDTGGDADAESEAEAGADADADSDADGDGGDVAAPSLTLTYVDPCPCYPPPCCPTTTLTFAPGSAAAWYLLCGDAVACAPPPVGWERQLAGGGWERVISPGESSTAGFLCAPGTWSDLGMYSIPEPPAGTVRAVGLFDDECGADPGTCTTRCGAPYEVFSNPVTIP